MLQAPVELMKLQLHPIGLPFRGQPLLCNRSDRVLRRGPGSVVRNPCLLNRISPDLVLHGSTLILCRPQQSLSHKSNECSAFDPELVLRDVPGKFG